MVTRFTLVVLLFAGIVACAGTVCAQDRYIEIQTAYPIRLPGASLPEAGIEDAIDCNSPAHIDANGNLNVFASVRHPFRSTGPNLFGLSTPAVKTTITNGENVVGGKWLEATYRDPDGTLYGWYHNEPPDVCENDSHLTAPRIGAMRSLDEGMTWEDLGIILEAPADSLNCNTKNYYFAGGNGDFSVLLDQDKKYFYFFFGSYHAQLEEQGISIARMAYADRNAPVGSVWKWFDGGWNEPGLGGHVKPLFPVAADWHSLAPDAFWGPSIHFNDYLNAYVILMNHAVNSYWEQEGVYYTFADDLSDPSSWSAPERLPIDPERRAYPQIIGLRSGDTDKQAGRYARLFLLGTSNYVLTFHRSRVDGQTCQEDCLPPSPPRQPRSTMLDQAAQPPIMVRAARPAFLTDLGGTRKPAAPRTTIKRAPIERQK